MCLWLTLQEECAAVTLKLRTTAAALDQATQRGDELAAQLEATQRLLEETQGCARCARCGPISALDSPQQAAHTLAHATGGLTCRGGAFRVRGM